MSDPLGLGDQAERRFCVYVITNTVNGKRYVGKTGDRERRWFMHRYNARNRICDGYLHKALRKYGDSAFTFRVIEECISETHAFEREVALIADLGTMIPAGYNMSAGGEGQTGFRHGPESRRKIGEKAGDCHRGKPKSDEQKAKIAATLREFFAKNGSPLSGVPKNVETRRKISEKAKGRIRNVGSKRTAEQRAKMSASHKGCVPWNKGKKCPPLSDACRAKKSVAMSARWASMGDDERVRRTVRLQIYNMTRAVLARYPEAYALEVDEQ